MGTKLYFQCPGNDPVSRAVPELSSALTAERMLRYGRMRLKANALPVKNCCKRTKQLRR
jgi:hypothetical protein